MKVYTVSEGIEWEGTTLIEIFKDKDKADALAKKLNSRKNNPGFYEVEEHEVTQ